MAIRINVESYETITTTKAEALFNYFPDQLLLSRCRHDGDHQD